MSHRERPTRAGRVPRRRSLLVLAGAVLTPTMFAAAPLADAAPASTAGTGGVEPGPTSGPDTHVPLTLLDGHTVYVVNLSSATMTNAAALVQTANDSTVTQAPDHYVATPPPGGGDFDNGDDIIVTDDGLYWLSLHCRAGLLTGMWPLAQHTVAGHVQLAFSNFANANGWAPNELLPGSEGDPQVPDQDCPSMPTIVPAVGGTYFLAVPLGGVDASTTCSEGTFAAGPGSNDWPVIGANEVVRGHAHSFSFAGTAGQEFVGDTPACGGVGQPNVALDDCTGNMVHLRYSVTYTFWDAGATATDFNGTSDQERVGERLQLTPVDYAKGATYACQGDPVRGRRGINLAYLNTPMDTQYYCPPGSNNTTSCTPTNGLRPMDRVESSVGMVQNSTLGAPCNLRRVPARRLGTLCTVPWADSGAQFSNLEQETPAGRPITAGQTNDGCTFESFEQSRSRTKGFTLLYPDASRSGHPLRPAPDRVEFISDGGADPPIISPESSYVDVSRETGRSAFLPINRTQTLAWDVQMQPYRPPVHCARQAARHT